MATSGTSTESSSMYSSADGDGMVYPQNGKDPSSLTMTTMMNLLDGNGFEDDDLALIDKILPRELLLKVFSYLDVVSLCRAAQTEVNSPVIQRLSQRTGGFLHALSLRGCRSLTDDALTELARSCPNLEILDLDDCKNLTDMACDAIAIHCTNLISLNLSGISITDRALESLSASEAIALKLIHLNLSFCSALTWRGLLKLINGPPSLMATSTLSSNNWTNGMSSSSSNNNNYNQSSQHRLSCSSTSSMTNRRQPFSSLRFFAAKMDINMMTDQSLTALTRASGRSLRTLILNNCTNLTDEGVASIGANCPYLSTLALSFCTHLTDASLLSLASGTPHLTTLEVASCSQLTDAGVSALARGCHQLSRLDLEELVQLTDASAAILASQCPNLTTLSLSHCDLITDEGLRALSMTQSPTLKVLELDNLSNITDEGLGHLSRLTCLQRLEIYDCQHLTRSGIRMIRGALPFLKIHAYFAEVTPNQGHLNGDGGLPEGNLNDPLDQANRRAICRCCSIL